VFRSLGEFFRSPDAGIFGQSDIISMGQWLSLPMILIGIWLIWRASQKTDAYSLKGFFAIFRASCGGVAQLGERRVRNAEVVSSILILSTSDFQQT
jgi:thiol:disulfide interchange protein